MGWPTSAHSETLHQGVERVSIHLIYWIKASATHSVVKKQASVVLLDRIQKALEYVRNFLSIYLLQDKPHFEMYKYVKWGDVRSSSKCAFDSYA